jgi:peptidoglycan/LPS O-acetylase OafA/YrhL
MNDLLDQIKRTLVAGLYLFVVAVGGQVLLIDPTSESLALPLAAAVLVAGHALRRDTLHEFGYAVLGFLGAIVSIVAVAAGSATVDAVPSPSDAVAMVLLAVVLSTVYTITVRDDAALGLD